ncbi:MAG: glycosyltransferase family 4 protein [Candidatus Brocadiae bacterium]|nr:glycosyltransferase family 4 protein [Candidatus Brocadiia bacterium]
MNVLHMNTRAMKGGAALAAYRLHVALRAGGHPSRIVCRDEVEGRDDLQTWLPRSPLWSLLWQMTSWSEIHLGLEGLANLNSWAGYHRHADWADVINLHNLHSCYFSMLLLPRLERRAPLVWTLHDMWALTGHCAYPLECERWLEGCGRCPRLAGPPRMERDTTRFLYRTRRRIYAKINPALVAPSRWMLEQARRAPLTEGFRAVHIPNGLDTSVFRPVDKAAARRMLRLGEGERVLLFGAYNLSEKRKGGDLLVEALRRLHAAGLRDLRLVIVGKGGAQWAGESAYPVLDLGEINNELFMAAVYSAADAFVLPTRADNLPLVLLESMACGTPCVSFRVGGVPEVVRPGRTGWLAAPEDAGDLARCLRDALTNDERRRAMSAVCREVAEKEYDVRLMARRYTHLYEELVEGRARLR